MGECSGDESGDIDTTDVHDEGDDGSDGVGDAGEHDAAWCSAENDGDDDGEPPLTVPLVSRTSLRSRSILADVQRDGGDGDVEEGEEEEEDDEAVATEILGDDVDDRATAVHPEEDAEDVDGEAVVLGPMLWTTRKGAAWEEDEAGVVEGAVVGTLAPPPVALLLWLASRA